MVGADKFINTNLSSESITFIYILNYPLFKDELCISTLSKSILGQLNKDSSIYRVSMMFLE